MHVTTFQDFAFKARHAMPSLGLTAATVHAHSYVVRVWFVQRPNHDKVRRHLKRWEKKLDGVRLDRVLTDSSDEGLAEYFLTAIKCGKCVKVRVKTDGYRGAKAKL